jgi:uncharacterized protein
MATDEKPSRNEEEYFAKLNADLIKERRSALDMARSKMERASHYMKCPRCGGDLKELEHHNVKIDQCADCKGVWLDAGELELLEHAHESGVTRFFSTMLGRR